MNLKTTWLAQLLIPRNGYSVPKAVGRTSPIPKTLGSFFFCFMVSKISVCFSSSSLDVVARHSKVEVDMQRFVNSRSKL